MEIEESDKEEVSQNSVTPGTDFQEKDLGDDSVSLDISIEVENSSLKALDNDSNETSAGQETNSENGKKKVKEEKPSSKIVIRRLPPTMTKDQFLEQVSPLPEIDYMYYVQGDVNNNVNPFSRAYLNFISPEDLFSFSRTFDNYVFLDSKGQEYPAVVEFSMFQRVPKQRSKKKDALMGTINSDPLFITFKENVLAEALEISKSGGKTMKQHYFETEISTTEEVNTTPLLEFLKVRRAERARIKEERREEKKRKELERKLKQKTKDKKGEGDEEDTPKEMKVLPTKDRRDNIRENNRANKKKEDKDKGKESRVREFKSRGGKSYQEERLKLAERREEQRKLLLNNSEKKIESSEQNDEVESSNNRNESLKEGEKIIRIETRKFDNKRNGKYDNEDWKDDSKKKNRNEKKNIKRDGRDRKDDYSRRHSDKRNNDSDNRRRMKNYKSSEFVKYDRKRNFEAENKSDSRDKSVDKNSSVNNKSKSWDDLTVVLGSPDKTTTNVESSKSRKRSSSLDCSTLKSESNYSDITQSDATGLRKKEKPNYKDNKGTENSGYVRSRKDTSNRRYQESKGNSRKKDRSDDKMEYAVISKSAENDFKDKDSGKTKESSTRAERRIRNKDRPSIEIYRPGMGKFSKQRLEKEKALGSSTEIESPSHSPSPIPKSKFIS